MFSVEIQGALKVAKWLERAKKEERRAFETALKVEGFRLKRLLAEEIRQGAPGGRRFAPLSKIRQRQKRGRGASIPLYKLASLVRYRTVKKADDSFFIRVGFLRQYAEDPTIPRRVRISQSWARIIEKHQRGFTSALDDETRKKLIQAGAPRRGKREALAPKAGTSSIRTPARPIADPFWLRHRGEVMRNVRWNYRRKLSGERI